MSYYKLLARRFNLDKMRWSRRLNEGVKDYEYDTWDNADHWGQPYEKQRRYWDIDCYDRKGEQAGSWDYYCNNYHSGWKTQKREDQRFDSYEEICVAARDEDFKVTTAHSAKMATTPLTCTAQGEEVRGGVTNVDTLEDERHDSVTKICDNKVELKLSPHILEPVRGPNSMELSLSQHVPEHVQEPNVLLNWMQDGENSLQPFRDIAVSVGEEMDDSLLNQVQAQLHSLQTYGGS